MSRDPFNYRRRKLQELLREARTAAGLSQADLAKRLRRPQSFVSKYESGERRLDFVEIGQICDVLGISLADFSRRFEENI